MAIGKWKLISAEREIKRENTMNEWTHNWIGHFPDGLI